MPRRHHIKNTDIREILKESRRLEALPHTDGDLLPELSDDFDWQGEEEYLDLHMTQDSNPHHHTPRF